MDPGLLTINALDESRGLSTPATRIRSSVDGAHWSAPNHVFGETIAVGMSEAKSEYDYKSLSLSNWTQVYPSILIIGW